MANAYPTQQELVDYIRKSAQERSIHPDVAVRVAQTEGLYADPAEGWQSKVVNKKTGKREPSYGVYQLYTGGGLGDEFQQKTGLDPRDPANVYATIDFALDHASKKGWGAFHGAKNNGIGEWAGINSLNNGVPQTRTGIPRTQKAGDVAAGTPEGNSYEYYSETGVDATPNVKHAGKPQLNIYGHVDWEGVNGQVREHIAYASQHLGIPLNITSGYRSLEHPVEKRKKPGSLHRHTTRSAVDLDVGGYDDATKQRIIETMVAMGATGVGIYPGGKMIHVDWSGLGGSYKGKGTLSAWDWSKKNPAWFKNGKANGLTLLKEGKLPQGNVISGTPTGAIPGMKQQSADISYEGGFYPENQTATQQYVRQQNANSVAGLPAGSVSTSDTWQAAQDSLMFTNQFSRLEKHWNFQNDPNWDRQKELPALLKTVPTDYWHMFRGVNSAEHASWMLDQVKKQQVWDAKIAANGWTGFGASMAYEIFNPLMLVGGIGAEIGAVKLLGGALKASRVGRAARLGLTGAAGGVGSEIGLDVLDARRHTMTDYAVAAGAGMVLGATFGIFSKGASVAEVKNNNQMARLGRELVYGQNNNGSVGAAYSPSSTILENAKGAEHYVDIEDLDEAAEAGLGRKIGNAMSNIPLIRNLVNPITKAEQIMSNGGGATAFNILRGIITDPRGARGGEVVQETVGDRWTMFVEGQMYEWKTIAEPQYDKWATRTLQGTEREMYRVGANDSARDKFFKLVDDYVWEEDDLLRSNFDPEVKAVGDAHAAMMERIGRTAYENGLIKDIVIHNPPLIEEYIEKVPLYEEVQIKNPDGTTTKKLERSYKDVETTAPDGTKTVSREAEFEDVKKTREIPQEPTVIKWEPDKHYAPLLKDEARFLEINDKFTDADIQKLIRRAFEEDFEGASEKLLNTLTRNYLDNLRKATLNMGDPMQRAVSTADRNQLMAFLKEDMGITDTSLVDEFMNLPLIRKRTEGGAANPRLKRRAFNRERYKLKMKLPYREGYKGKRVADDGEEVSIRDFFVRQSDHQMQRYIHNMAGSLAWSKLKVRDPKTGELIIDGVRNDGDYARLKETIHASTLAKNPKLGSQVEDILKDLDFMWEAMTKNGGANPKMAKIGRRITQSMFNLLMQNLGVNSIQEVSNTMATAGVINTFKGVPAFGRMLDDAGRSVPIDKTRKNLEALLGVGYKPLLGSENYVAKLNRTGDENMSSAFGRGFDTVNGKVQNAVMIASGFKYLDNGLQVNAVQAMANEFEDMTKKYAAKLESGTFKVDDLNNGFFSAQDAKRMRGLGLGDKELTKVLKNMKEHGTENLDKWDGEALSSFRLALHRYYRRSIQQNDVGALSRWLQHPVAKVLLQFRSFAMVGMDKQFMYGLNHFDGRQAFQWALNTTIAGSVWYLYNKAISYGHKDPDQYMKDKFGEPGSYEFYRNLAIAGYTRSGFSTVFPMFYDTAAGALDLPQLNTRTSGQVTAIWGAPFYSQIENITKASNALVRSVKEDRELARQEINTIFRTVLGNHFIIPLITGLATQDRAEYPPRQ